MPYDYRTVKDQYDMLHGAGVVSEPLETWSARKNQESGTDAYNAGLEGDSYIKDLSVGLDKLLEMTGVPAVTGAIGGAVGSGLEALGLEGAAEEGAKMGRKVPRGLVNYAPMALSVLGPGGVAAGVAGTAAMSGAETYEETGSPAASLISGGVAAAMPGVGGLARKAVLKGLGAEEVTGQVVGGVEKLLQRAGITGTEEALPGMLAAGAPTRRIAEYIPKNLGQGLAAYGAEQVAGSVLGEAGNIASAQFGDQPYEFSPTTALLNMTVGQMPFAAMSAFRHGRVQFGMGAARAHEAQLKTSVELSEKAIEAHRLNEEESGKTTFEVAPDTPEEVAARESRVARLSELREKQRAARADGTTVGEAERQKLADEDNSILQEQWGKKPMPGHILGVPIDAMPERPTMTDDPVIRLQTAEQRMAAAKDNVDVQDAVGDINDVRQRYGMKPLDDAEIVGRQQRLSLGSDREAIQSHIDETRRLATAKEEGAALKTEVNLKMAELNHPDPTVQAAAMARLREIHAGSKDLDNVRFIANAPLNRDSAPVKSFMNEQATRIVESDPRDVLPEDKQKFLDYVSGGTTALMKNHAMGAEEAGNWLNDNPHVESWRSRLEMQVKDGLTMQDYAERHLMQQGITETEAKQKAAVATSLAGKPDLLNNLLATPTEGAEVKKAGAAMADLLATEPEPTKQIFDEVKVGNADELYDKFVRSGADESVLVNLDGKVKDYIYAKAREHRQLVDVMKSAEDTKYVNSPVESPEAVQKALRDIGNIETKQIRQAADVSGLSGIAPKTFMENIVSKYQEFKPEFMDPLEGGARRLADAFKTPAWLSKISQHLAEFVTKGHQLSPNIRKMAFESFKAFGMDEKGNWDKQLVKSMKDQQVRGALSKWIGINQRIGSKMAPDGSSPGVKVIPPDHPDVARALEGLSPEKKKAVQDLMQRQEISTQQMQKEELGKMEEIATTNGTEFLGPRTGLKYDQNLKLSNDMMNLVKVDWNDPTQAQQGQELMNKLQMQFADKPEVYTEFYRTMGEKWAEIQQKQAFFEKNPAWSTEQGYGKYTFTYLKGNKFIKDTADSKAQAREIANGNQIKDLVRNDDYHDTPVNYERDIPIEQADSRWFDNHVTWLNKNATYWSRALYRAQSRALLNDPEMSQRPDVMRLAKQHSDNMLSPEPTFGKMANGFVSTWYLGWNAASAMVNATQLMTRGMAEMTRLTGSPVESYNRIMRGYKDMYDMWMPGAAGLSDEKQRIVQRLERDGVTTVTSEMSGAGDAEPGLDLKRMLSGRGPLKSAAGNLSRGFQNAGMWMFKKMETVNNIGAVFAAFDHFRTQKDAYGKQLSFDDAYNRAVQFNQAVNDVGGKANRPIDLMSGTGEVSKSLGMMATSLQTYNIGTIGQILSYIKRGVFSQPGMAPGERYKNNFALGQLFLTQLAAAGMVGMPFMGTVQAVAQQIWPGLEPEKNFRGLVNKTFATLLNDDEADGGVLADMAMTGIPSMFGWDFQGRLSMGNPTMGVSEINGFQPELLLGAPTELTSKFLKGGAAMLSGAPLMSYVGNMVPPAAKKLIDLATSGGKILDYNGKPVVEQTTPGEKVGMAMGFQPTRMSEFRKANRMSARSQSASDEESKQFNQQQAAELVANGNFGDIKKRLLARMQEKLKTKPDYNVETQARQIVAAASALTFPNDLRRKLSSQDAKIAKWFALPLNQPAEVQRAQFEATALRNLGVAYKPKDMQKYALMDQIEAQNPGQFTRTEKRRLAEKAMNRVQRTPRLAEDSG